MSIYGRLGRVGAAVVAGGLVLGLTAIPAGSQALPEETVTLTGTAVCRVIEGGQMWDINYNLHNNIAPEVIVGAIPAAFGDVTVDSAVVSLDGTDISPTFFDPNPVPAGGDATTGGAMPGDVAGTFTIVVDWTAPSVEDSGTATLDLTLDGTCVAPVVEPTTPTTPTTQGPAVQAEAVAVAPSFTG